MNNPGYFDSVRQEAEDDDGGEGFPMTLFRRRAFPCEVCCPA